MDVKKRKPHKLHTRKKAESWNKLEHKKETFNRLLASTAKFKCPVPGSRGKKTEPKVEGCDSRTKNFQFLEFSEAKKRGEVEDVEESLKGEVAEVTESLKGEIEEVEET